MNRKIYIVLFFAVLLYGLVNSINDQIDINKLENRPAVKFDSISLLKYTGGVTQKNIEDALKDQLPFAEDATRLLNYAKSTLSGEIMKISNIRNRYIDFNRLYLFNDEYILYPPRVLKKLTPALDVKIRNTNNLIGKHPELDFYIYYIEKDTDIDFETNKKVGVFEYLSSKLNLNNSHMDKFSVDSFEDYSKYFFKTDHHWNNIGAYKGYLDILELLNVDEPLSIENTIIFKDALSGSKAVTTGAMDYMFEDFAINEYSLPKYEIKINGIEAEYYGNYNRFNKNPPTRITYGEYYGGDHGGIYFNMNEESKDSILILGESFDNPILNLLASHFDKTYAIDLRYYESELGKDFNFDNFIRGNSIDKVLMIGNVDFFTLDDFIVK